MLLIADTSVLINFLNIDGMHLIGRHQPQCVVTPHVLDEVTNLYSEQREQLDAAITAGYVMELGAVAEPDEVAIFGRLQPPSGRLGVGESSAIAVAIHRGYALAIDDRRAIRDAQQIATAADVRLEILRTQDIIVRLIRSGLLSREQADVHLVSWRTRHRFHLPIGSFTELL
jgi:predicted nucleic acid-binding protein